eukprot:gene40654-49567_t
MAQSSTSWEVHRLRIGDWHPKTIRSVAVGYHNIGKDEKTDGFVAVGREDGEIEILSAKDNYGLVTRISGSVDFQLQALCWSQHHEEDTLEGPSGAKYQRLFGISLRGFIFEADLGVRGLKNVSDTYGGAAWSLVSSPRSTNLFVGCEDGSVRVFSHITSPSRLVYVRAFPTGAGRVLCLAVHPTARRIYAGCLDGSVRCLDEDNGRQLFKTSGV